MYHNKNIQANEPTQLHGLESNLQPETDLIKGA